ncbi:MAG: hypothetical protein ABI361_02025 [Nitrososphaera sp.]
MVNVAREGKDFRGICFHCGSRATKELLFKEEHCTVIERYCDPCSEKAARGEAFFFIRTLDTEPGDYARFATL